MTAFVLVLALVLCADPVTLQLDWGDDLASSVQDASIRATDVPLIAPGSGVPPTTPVVASELLSVCPCMGYKRGVCHCLARGVTCKCSARIGSEWTMANGRPVRKTGRYLDPRTPLVEPMLAVSVGDVLDDTVPTKRTDGRYWFKRPDGRWCGVASLTDGAEYTSGAYRFVYRNGRMTPAMAVQIAPAAKGRWVMRCYGSFCRREWVSE